MLRNILTAVVKEAIVGLCSVYEIVAMYVMMSCGLGWSGATFGVPVCPLVGLKGTTAPDRLVGRTKGEG